MNQGPSKEHRCQASGCCRVYNAEATSSQAEQQLPSSIWLKNFPFLALLCVTRQPFLCMVLGIYNNASWTEHIPSLNQLHGWLRIPSEDEGVTMQMGDQLSTFYKQLLMDFTFKDERNTRHLLRILRDSTSSCVPSVWLWLELSL